MESEYITLFIFGLSISLFTFFANLAEEKRIARLLCVSGLALACILEILFSIFIFFLLAFLPSPYLSILRISAHAIFFYGAGFFVAGAAGCLILFKKIRARLPLPMNPDSILHASGLFLVAQAMAIFLFFTIANNPLEKDPSSLPPVRNAELVANMIIYLAVAFLAVGFPLRRSLGQSISRLGLSFPSSRQIAFSILYCVALLFIGEALYRLEGLFFPQMHASVQELLKSILSSLENDWTGILLIGLCAGIGEETLFRGALQPRYGIPLTSCFFALGHVTLYGLTFGVINALAGGFFFGYLRKRTNTTACIFSHALYNIVTTFI